jgi:hypothetical protein
MIHCASGLLILSIGIVVFINGTDSVGLMWLLPMQIEIMSQDWLTKYANKIRHIDLQI